eukprot:COSAG02_NODE_541_length_20598_cov_278.953754_2_plen_78_part_00
MRRGLAWEAVNNSARFGLQRDGRDGLARGQGQPTLSYKMDGAEVEDGLEVEDTAVLTRSKLRKREREEAPVAARTRK